MESLSGLLTITSSTSSSAGIPSSEAATEKASEQQLEVKRESLVRSHNKWLFLTLPNPLDPDWHSPADQVCICE